MTTSFVKIAWLSILTFTPTGDASAAYDFLGENTDVRTWQPHLPRRGSSRARAFNHGTNPRRTRLEGLQNTHEGVFGPAAQDDVLTERDLLLDAITPAFGEAPSDATAAGTLVVKYANWDESAYSLVSIDDHQAYFSDGDIATLSYQIQWRCDAPYFLGSISGDPVLLG